MKMRRRTATGRGVPTLVPLPRLAVVVRMTGRRGKHPHLCQCNAPVYTTYSYNIPVAFDLKPVVPVLGRVRRMVRGGGGGAGSAGRGRGAALTE